MKQLSRVQLLRGAFDLHASLLETSQKLIRTEDQLVLSVQELNETKETQQETVSALQRELQACHVSLREKEDHINRLVKELIDLKGAVKKSSESTETAAAVALLENELTQAQANIIRLEREFRMQFGRTHGKEATSQIVKERAELRCLRAQREMDKARLHEAIKRISLLESGGKTLPVEHRELRRSPVLEGSCGQVDRSPANFGEPTASDDQQETQPGFSQCIGPCTSTSVSQGIQTIQNEEPSKCSARTQTEEPCDTLNLRAQNAILVVQLTEQQAVRHNLDMYIVKLEELIEKEFSEAFLQMKETDEKFVCPSVGNLHHPSHRTTHNHHSNRTGCDAEIRAMEEVQALRLQHIFVQKSNEQTKMEVSRLEKALEDSRGTVLSLQTEVRRLTRELEEEKLCNEQNKEQLRNTTLTTERLDELLSFERMVPIFEKRVEELESRDRQANELELLLAARETEFSKQLAFDRRLNKEVAQLRSALEEKTRTNTMLLIDSGVQVDTVGLLLVGRRFREICAVTESSFHAACVEKMEVVLEAHIQGVVLARPFPSSTRSTSVAHHHQAKEETLPSFGGAVTKNSHHIAPTLTELAAGESYRPYDRSLPLPGMAPCEDVGVQTPSSSAVRQSVASPPEQTKSLLPSTSVLPPLGVEVVEVDGELIVESVLENSPCCRAGVLPRDRIETINGEIVCTLNDIQRACEHFAFSHGTAVIPHDIELIVEVKRLHEGRSASLLEGSGAQLVSLRVQWS